MDRIGGISKGIPSINSGSQQEYFPTAAEGRYPSPYGVDCTQLSHEAMSLMSNHRSFVQNDPLTQFIREHPEMQAYMDRT